MMRFAATAFPSGTHRPRPRFPRAAAALLILVSAAAGLGAARAEEPKPCTPEAFNSAEAKLGQARVAAPERTNFRDEGGNCPDESPACLRRGFVMTNDEVATAQTSGDYICAYFPDLKGGSAGYLPRAALTPLPAGPVSAKRKLPAPQKGESFLGFCERLGRRTEILFKCEVDTDHLDRSHPSQGRTLRIPWASVEAGLELAKPLFDIPASVKLPAQGPAEQVIDLKPDPKRHLDMARLTVKRNQAGRITGVDYFEKAEAGGRSVDLTRTGPVLVISEQSFAD
jgi:hypothetical protein